MKKNDNKEGLQSEFMPEIARVLAEQARRIAWKDPYFARIVAAYTLDPVMFKKTVQSSLRDNKDEKRGT